MKTAIDNYSLGKQKETDASDFPEGIKFPVGRFICSECGENVFLSRGKYVNHFKHYHKSSISAECDRRVDGNSNLSVYERLGMPIYLKSENGNYNLYMGFKTISLNTIELASNLNAYICIDDIQKYFVNRQRFSNYETIYIKLNHIPAINKQYKISFSECAATDLLRKTWVDFADGFSYEGALFSFTEFCGRKLRHGDEMATETDYYWVRRNEIPEYLQGMKVNLCGYMDIDKIRYRIYQININATLSDEIAFKKLECFFKTNLHLYLLVKKPEICLLWPPGVSNSDGFSILNRNKNLFCMVKSGNDNPKVYQYLQNDGYPLSLTCESLDKYSLTRIPIYDHWSLINVDRKLSSTGTQIKRSNSGVILDEFLLMDGISNNNIYLQDVLGDFSYFEIITEANVECYFVSSEGNVAKIFGKNKKYIFEKMKDKDEIYVLSHHKIIYHLKIQKSIMKIEKFHFDEFYNWINISKNTAKIIITNEIREKLKEIMHHSTGSYKQYLVKCLNTNAAPKILIEKLRMGYKNE